MSFIFSSSYDVASRAINFTFDSSFRVLTAQGFLFNTSYIVTNSQSFDFSSSYEAKDPQNQSFSFGSNYLIGSFLGVSLYQAPTLSVEGVSYDLNLEADSLTITANTSNVGYTMTLTGSNLPDVARDSKLTLVIGDETYEFIVDKVDIDADGVASKTKTITAVSPVMLAALPRAETRDLTNDTDMTAEALVKGLLPVTVHWRIGNWTIPAFRLAVQGQTPLQIADQIVKASGAVLQGLPNGEVEVIYDYPVSPPDYEFTTPDHSLNSYDHLFTLRTSLVPKDGFNLFMVTDTNTNTGGLSDALDFDVLGKSKVAITAYLTSDRPVKLTDTAPEELSITQDPSVNSVTETETVEVISGKATVLRPIESIVNVEFLSLPLTGIAFTSGSTELNVGSASDYGLIKIEYTTLATTFLVEDITSPKVQFLLEDL